jgi:Cu(I)/Ag(I) efflux system membrane protein CusA/SilA
MIGGMVSSTVLTLIVIPAIYALVKGARLPKAPLRPAVQSAPVFAMMGETHDA